MKKDTTKPAGEDNTALPPKMKPTVRKKEKRYLKCQLTQDEIMAAGQKMADAQQRLTELDAELENFKTQHKAKTATAEGEVAVNASLVRQKYEMRNIVCETVRIYETERVEITREDTGEMIEDRFMNAEELSQLPL